MLSHSLSRGAITIEARFTGVDTGDLGVSRLVTGGAESMSSEDAEFHRELLQRRRAVHSQPWAWLRQVHGPRVIEVTDPVRLPAGIEGDAMVSALDDVPLAIHTADCGPVLLVGDGGQFGVVHAGWRGAAAGVLGATVDALRRHGCHRIHAVVGPAIGPECYEFGSAQLAALSGQLGPEIMATTATGAPALDMRAAIRLQLVAASVDPNDIEVMDICTACSPGYYSHRARNERGRQALIAWRTQTPTN